MAVRRQRMRPAAALVVLSRLIHALARLHLRGVTALGRAGLIPRRALGPALRSAARPDRVSGQLALRALRLWRRRAGG